MKPISIKPYTITALTLILGALAAAPSANSQPITPANDGTGTTVNQNGNQFNIQGGTRSGGNLFHSFDQFNVPTNQTANFLTTPDTQNILGRITGGNASYINGLIQVIGGNSNLFLINPAGIMFGPNATLNVPASFSVTTATGIGFDSNNYWFQAMGTNDYSKLVGTPSGYRFDVSNPGAVVNEANLSLNPGENLTLLGGTVVNTGEMSSAGGNITIAAVEGESILRISQPGNLLSLEVETFQGTSLENGENTNITPLSLPQLLTGGEETHASSVIVNADGQIVLTDSNTLVADTPGTAITSGNIDVSTTSTSHTSFQGEYNVGGQVNVLGSRVALIDTNINANGTNGGGTALIGGDFQGNGIVPNSQQTFVNNNSFISADAINNGDGGRVIVWSDGITNFGGNISAKGGDFSGDGGFVEVSGKQELIFDGSVDVSAAFGNPGTILLDPENITVGEDNSETETETQGDNSEVSATENSENSETETEGDNSEVSATENSENSETETEGDNSEVSATENTENLETTEIADNSETETVDNNSEVPSPENTDSPTTEIADNSETTETETPIDPFAQDENSDVTISAENLGELSGDVILLADNDITINEKIETDSSVELKAGRSININADIDTSIGNGNIDLFGNNDEMNLANRSEGAASINQLDGTTLNAGSGTINIELGSLGEVGDINLANLSTTGEVFVNANGGNIARVSDSSIINAGSVLFQTSGNGGIGLTNAPLQLNVENLEAVSGTGGVFFDVGNINIGDVSEDVNGIATAGGDIDIKSAGNVTLTEAISTIETVENNSEVGATENTEVTDTNGSINIEATGDIVATGSGIKGGGESVSLSATNIRINDEFDETSGDADVKLSATNDITVEDIEDDVLEFLPGGGEIEFRADVDGDGVGVVEMLDNEADVGSNPGTFENGADTIKTNGRDLTIAGAGIVLGNIDTSTELPVFSGGELLAAIDVDEGGRIPPEDTQGTAIFTFTVDGDLETIENLDVRFSAEHTFDGDLEVYLKSPAGNEVTLFANVGGGGDNFQDTVLDDNASTNINSGNASFDGTYRPQGSLAEFNGENPNGTWTLRVEDTAGGDSGRLYKAGDDAVWGTTAIGTQLLLRSPLVESAGGKGSGNGGAINLEATHNNISVGNLRSFSETNDGGRIDLKANNNIITGLINSSSRQGNGGDVNLNSISGNIDIFSLDTSSFDGDGGNLEIKAAGDITTAEIVTDAGAFDVNQFQGTNGGSGNAGNISIESTEGSIDTTAGSVFARSVSADGGDITMTAGGNIQTASRDAGNINITAESNTTLNSSSINGEAGNVELSASGDINTANISASSEKGNGGNITISSNNGSVDTTGGFISSYSDNESAGNVDISASGDIKTGDINTYSGKLENNDQETGQTEETGESNDKVREETGNNESPNIEELGNGTGGNVTITSEDGSVDTTGGWIRTSANDEAGNVDISASGDINTRDISSFSYEGKGGDINITSNNGAIDTTKGNATLFNPLPNDADIEEVANRFETTPANLDAYAPEGTGGNVTLTAKGDITTYEISSYGGNISGNVNITSTEGNINTDVIFSVGVNESGGNISIQTQEEGNININHIATYSTNGTGGEVNLDSGGSVIINNIASFGEQQSGDIRISSESEIQTANLTTQSDAGPSGNIVVNGRNVATGNLRSLGRTAAGKIQVEATDGSILTADIESSSTEGEAGGIDLDASEDIETGDQTVDSTEGDASINNNAGGDVNTGDQIATTENGDAIIDNDAGRDVNTGDQIATTENGDAIIDNDAGRDINTGDQIATTENGDASINNNAGGDINTGDQTAIGDTTSITNEPGGELNTGEIIEISPPPGLTGNTLPQPLPSPSVTPPPIPNLVQPPVTPLPAPNLVQAPVTSPPAPNLVQPPVTPTPAPNLVQPPVTPLPAPNLVQPPVTPTPAPNLVQPPITPTPAPNLAQPPVPPTPIPENSPPSNNPVLNSVTTNPIQLVQSDSTIATANNPNLPNQESVGQQVNLNTDTKTALRNINTINSTPLTVTANFQTLASIEQNRNNEFADYFGKELSSQITSTQNIREVLDKIARQTGNNSAIIYVTAYSQELQLILYTRGTEPLLKTIRDVNRKELMKAVLQLRVHITNPALRHTDSYLPPAQQLYDWLLAPISAELKLANIDTLLFSMDEGLRTFPVAVLHDGEQFLIEKYSLSLIPSVSLMDTNYRPLQDTQVLAMGASEFMEQKPLPAVPVELETISQKLWQGSKFINEEFTYNNLLNERKNYPYPIIHLATHAEFKPGKASNSYIQLWGNEQIKLDQVRELGWSQPAVELLVLSACRTAIGDTNAELGYAGLAVAAGVKSAVASIWYVSDEGTLGLMTEFYTHLNNAKIKAEALRQAQLAMLRGEVVITEGELRGTGAVVLPSALANIENHNFSHPYYWSGFMMVGSPW